MFEPADREVLAGIAADLAALKDKSYERNRAQRERDAAVVALLDDLATEVNTRATKAQVQKIKALLREHDAQEATP